jgi:hypothetical protein
MSRVGDETSRIGRVALWLSGRRSERGSLRAPARRGDGRTSPEALRTDAGNPGNVESGPVMLTALDNGQRSPSQLLATLRDS